ncbi:hypothetical protein NIES593_15055 [Hydrococcus rivularis NIES-593]|uniref:Transposase putative helix-turn-helix domain-containing protein n=1 Tax=Hydrococcus rivularis NIES-593 TaxID=1921803 RepID=A0A1U7HDT8_9CYAN|nr:helix-turn-helix domain-containing protein [Hydrococcus rivularis]OKH21740.1 hypothetical protein NIES593_15055 [Hydrococcus rivularis NIES-593]
MINWKTELDFNNKQKTLTKKHAGVRRHAFNWGLSVIKEEIENKSKIEAEKLPISNKPQQVVGVDPWY